MQDLYAQFQGKKSICVFLISKFQIGPHIYFRFVFFALPGDLLLPLSDRTTNIKRTTELEFLKANFNLEAIFLPLPRGSCSRSMTIEVFHNRECQPYLRSGMKMLPMKSVLENTAFKFNNCLSAQVNTS